MPNVGPGFYTKLLEVASEVQMKPEDLLSVMAFESGINPAARNPNGNASGLIQFMPSTLKNVGFDGNHSDFRKLSAEDQLEYVKRYVKMQSQHYGKPFESAAKYYVANFVPAALKLPGIQRSDPSTILAAQHPDHPHLPGVTVSEEQNIYNTNKVLDVDKDGAITYGDIQKTMANASHTKTYQSAVSQLQSTTGYEPTVTKTPPSMVARRDNFFGRFLDKLRNVDVYRELGHYTPAPANDITQVIENFLRQVAATEKHNKQLYKKFLPTNHLVIQVRASSFTDAVEFSRILCSVLDTELLSTSFIHTNGRLVEVETSIPGPEKECFALAEQLTLSTASAFETATRKIGSIKVTSKFIRNKKSSYQQIGLHTATSQYRKFLLKFI